MRPGSLILVTMAEQVEQGYTFERKRQEWPLHVTLVPWFETDANKNDVIKRLTNTVRTLNAFDAVIGAEDNFGPNGDVRVNVVSDPHHFSFLHNVVVAALDELAPKYISEIYMRENYKPHVTHHGTNHMHIGDIVHVQDVAVVEYQEHNMCEVAAFVPLGKPHD